MTENRMKRKKTGMIWLIFTIIWMSVIFSFSAKKAVESEGMSHSVGKEIGRLIVPQFTSWSEERQEQFAKMIDFPVRKCAHATEYAVLGVLILRTAYSFSEDSGKRSMLICWCAGTAYAASDELHQLFVPGRSCQFRGPSLPPGRSADGPVYVFVFMCGIFIRGRAVPDGIRESGRAGAE